MTDDKFDSLVEQTKGMVGFTLLGMATLLLARVMHDATKEVVREMRLARTNGLEPMRVVNG
jgi:hypothetical protein